MTPHPILIDTILHSAIDTAMSYTAFYNMTSALVADNNTSGPVKSEERIQATKLNLQRLTRLNKTTQLLPEWSNLDVAKTSNLQWVVITEDHPATPATTRWPLPRRGCANWLLLAGKSSDTADQNDVLPTPESEHRPLGQ